MSSHLRSRSVPDRSHNIKNGSASIMSTASSARRGASPSPRTAPTTQFSLNSAQREYDVGLGHLDNLDPESAVRHLLLALTAIKNSGASDHVLLGNVMLSLGNAHAELGHNNEARSYFQWTHDLMARHEGPEFVGLATPLLNLGVLMCTERDYGTAYTVLKDAARHLENVFGADRVLLADVYHNLGVASDGLNRIPQALHYYAKAIRIREHFPDKSTLNASRIALTMENVSMCWRAQGNHNEAFKLIQKVLSIRRKNPGAGTLEYAQSLLSAGIIALDMRKANFAGSHLESASKLFLQLLGPDHPLTRQSLRLTQSAAATGAFSPSTSAPPSPTASSINNNHMQKQRAPHYQQQQFTHPHDDRAGNFEISPSKFAAAPVGAGGGGPPMMMPQHQQYPYHHQQQQQQQQQELVYSRTSGSSVNNNNNNNANSNNNIMGGAGPFEYVRPQQQQLPTKRTSSSHHYHR
eukprot:PhM_4_TR5728/c1_g1_i1/m.90490